MARKRQLEPEIWGNRKFVKLSFNARLLYIGILTQADDEGRLHGDLISLKTSIYPGDSVDLQDLHSWRKEVTDARMITLYEVGEDEFITIPSFPDHQYMTKKYPSKLPAPPVINQLITTPQPVINQCDDNDNDIDNGIGIDNGVVRTKITNHQTLAETYREELAPKYTDLDFTHECHKCWTYFIHKRTKGKPNWKLRLMNWLDNARKFKGSSDRAPQRYTKPEEIGVHYDD